MLSVCVWPVVQHQADTSPLRVHRHMPSSPQAQNSAAEQEVWAQLQERYSPAALAAMGKLAADASSSRRAGSSSSSGGRQQQRGPAESALLAEVPSQSRRK
jgi:hypothetical protein